MGLRGGPFVRIIDSQGNMTAAVDKVMQGQGLECRILDNNRMSQVRRGSMVWVARCRSMKG